MSYIKKLLIRIRLLKRCSVKRIFRKKPKITLTPKTAYIYTDTIKLNKRAKNFTKTETKWLFRYKG